VAYATVSFATTGSHLLSTVGETATLNFSGCTGWSILKICTCDVDPINNLSLNGKIVSISNPTPTVFFNTGLEAILISKTCNRLSSTAYR
jgi:hypothetical protein